MKKTLSLCLAAASLLVTPTMAAGRTTFHCEVAPMCNITVYNRHGVPVTNFLVPTGQSRTPTHTLDAGFSYCVTDRPGQQMMRRDCGKYSVTHWRSLRPGAPGVIDITK